MKIWSGCLRRSSLFLFPIILSIAIHHSSSFKPPAVYISHIASSSVFSARKRCSMLGCVINIKHKLGELHKKNRMSHDNRFSKTNYLKTNLLKQIKKISFVGKFRYFLMLFCCKDSFFLSYSQKIIEKNYPYCTKLTLWRPTSPLPCRNHLSSMPSLAILVRCKIYSHSICISFIFIVSLQ